jgi:hypothetical protein
LTFDLDGKGRVISNDTPDDILEGHPDDNINMQQTQYDNPEDYLDDSTKIQHS